MHTYLEKIYGRAVGKSRRKQVQAILNGPDKLVPPARCAKRNLMAVEPSKLGVGNHDGLATDEYVQYKLSRYSKNQMQKELNLTNYMLTNVINVSQKLKEMDRCERKKRKDKDTDCLGII